MKEINGVFCTSKKVMFCGIPAYRGVYGHKYGDKKIWENTCEPARTTREDAEEDAVFEATSFLALNKNFINTNT